MSNVAQIQLRYLTVGTLDDLRAQVNAFPGNMSLVLENKTMYQYVEYEDATKMPVDDGVSIIATNNEDLLGCWVQIDSYSTKAIEGTFTSTATSWTDQDTVEDDTFELRIPVVNPVNDFILKLWEINNAQHKREVIPQDIFVKKNTDGVTEIIVSIAKIPDCRFAGSYFILKDKML